MATADGTPTTHSGMKWGGSGGDALTQVGSSLTIGPYAVLSAWRLIAPTATTGTAYGNWAAAQNQDCIAMLSYTGVDQTTPVGTAVTATGLVDAGGAGTATVNVTTVPGDLVVACAWSQNESQATNPQLTPSGGSTGRYEVEGTTIEGGWAALQVIELVATGTTTTMSIDIVGAQNNGGNDRWGIIAFVVNQAAAGNDLMGMSCL